MNGSAELRFSMLATVVASFFFISALSSLLHSVMLSAMILLTMTAISACNPAGV